MAVQRSREELRKQWRIRQSRRRERLREEVERLHPPVQCVRCKRYDEPTELAHIKPTGVNGSSRGATEVLKDVIQNPDCYVRLCISCHRAYDSGKVGLELEEAPF